MDFHIIANHLAIIVGAATFGAILCSMIKIPPIVGYILAGLAIGPSGIGFIQSMPGANIITEFAAIFLLFTIGLELSFQSLKSYKRLIFITGLGQIVLSWIIFGGITYVFFGNNWPQSLFWGFILSLSSTAIVMKLLTQQRELNAPHGKVITGVLITQDLFVIPMTLAIPLLATSHDVLNTLTWKDIAEWLGELTAILILLFLGAKFIVPRILEKAAKNKSREIFLFTIILMCMLFAITFESLKLSLALGAFLAGLIIADSPFGKKASTDMELIRDVFLALFFCSIGLLVDLNFIIKNWINLAGFTLGVFLIKSLIVLFTGYLAKVSWKNSLIAGILTAQIGEFSFVLAEVGKRSNLFSEEGYQYFLGVTIITMLVTPFSFMNAPRLLFARKKHTPRNAQEKLQSSDAIIIGYGVAGQKISQVLKHSNYSYKIVESNYALVKEFSSKGEPIVFGDGSNPEFLHSIQIEETKLVIICVAGVNGTEAVLRSIQEFKDHHQILIRVTYSAEKNKLRKLLPEDQIIDAEGLASRRLSRKVVDTLEKASVENLLEV